MSLSDCLSIIVMFMFFLGNEAFCQNGHAMPIAASSPRRGDQNRLQAQARGLTLGDLVMELSIHGTPGIKSSWMTMT